MKAGILLLLFLIITTSPSLSQEKKPILTIDSAVMIALEKNPELKSAYNETVAAKWAKRNAYSDFLPKISVIQKYTRYDSQSVERTNLPIDLIKSFPQFEDMDIQPSVYENNYATGINLTMPIYNGGALINNAKISSEKKKIKELNYKQKRLDVVFNTRTGFLTYLKSTEYVKLKKKMADLFEKNLSSSKAMARRGMITETDLLRWQVQLTNANSELVNSQNLMDLGYIALLNTMGIGLETEYQVIPVNDDKINQVLEKYKTLANAKGIADLSEWIKSAENNNLQLLTVKRTTEISNIGVGLAKSNFLPKLNFSYNYGWVENNTIAPDDSENWSAAIVLKIPIFRGLSNYYSYNEAKFNLKTAINHEKYAKDRVGTQTINALLNIKSAIFRLRYAEKGKLQGEKNIVKMERKYNLGMVKTLDLIDAQVAFIQANLNWINAKYDLLAASYELEKIMAGS